MLANPPTLMDYAFQCSPLAISHHQPYCHWYMDVQHPFLTAFYSLTEHFVDAPRQQKKPVYELSGPFRLQTTKTRRQARKDEGGVSSCLTLDSPLLRQTRS
jgi:hypothetical protein